MTAVCHGKKKTGDVRSVEGGQTARLGRPAREVSRGRYLPSEDSPPPEVEPELPTRRSTRQRTELRPTCPTATRCSTTPASSSSSEESAEGAECPARPVRLVPTTPFPTPWPTTRPHAGEARRSPARACPILKVESPKPRWSQKRSNTPTHLHASPLGTIT